MLSSELDQIIEILLRHSKGSKKPFLIFLFDTRLERVLFWVSSITLLIGFAASLLTSLLDVSEVIFVLSFGLFFLTTLFLFVTSTVVNISWLINRFPKYLQSLQERIKKDEKLVLDLAKLHVGALEGFRKRVQFERGQILSRVTSLAGDKVGILAALTALTPLLTQQWDVARLPSVLIGSVYFAAVISQSLLRSLERLEFLLQLSIEQAKGSKNQGRATLTKAFGGDKELKVDDERAL